MRRRHILCVVAAFMLLLAITATLSKLTTTIGGIDLSGSDPARLKPSTTAVLSRLQGRVTLTYFTSSKDKMPADMKDVEPTMRRMLEALRRVAPGRINVQVVDPDIDVKNGALYAGRKAVAPVKLRKVKFDATSEQAIWSGLDIAFNDYPNAVIPFITRAELPYMQDLILNNLRMMVQPASSVIAVSAPAEGFATLPKVLAALPNTSIVKLDFESLATIPSAIDLFMWIAPQRIEERHLRELERFVESGRSLVIAGGDYEVECSTQIGSASCRVERPTSDFRRLTKTFGVETRGEVVVDAPIRVPGASMPFPIHFPATLTDIRALHGFAIGELHVSSVSALDADPDLLAQSGFDADIIATTSAETRLAVIASGVFGQEAIRRAVPTSKQPWVVRLQPKDSWRGSVIVVGTPSVFSDVFIEKSDNANSLLLKAVTETLISQERIARLRVDRRLPQAIPPLSELRRLVVRVLVIGLVPLCLLWFAIKSAGGRFRLPQGLPSTNIAWRAPAALFGILLLSGFVTTLPFSPVDASGDASTTSDATVTSLLSRQPGPVEVELVVSAQRYWPTEHKSVEREIRAALRGLGLSYRIIRPENLSIEEQNRIIDAGIRPFSIQRVEGDQTVRSRVWCGLHVKNPAHATVVPEVAPSMLRDLQFLIAAALLRIERGSPGPLVGFVSDNPRLSQAQAYEEYTQMGATPPEGNDPFSEVSSLLEKYGYQVYSINPKLPTFSTMLDLVIWLQPRVSSDALPDFSRYLAYGGNAFVALQQYKVKQRQYRGSGYQTVYWPEPQTHRFNQYLKLLGVYQMGEKDGGLAEILMDINQGRLALDTRVYQRSRYREMLKQEVVRPFLIRAIGEGLSSSSLLTSRLGALLYIWGNRFTLDQEKLSSLGLEVTPLVETSPRPWRFMWDGGWIPEPMLSSPTPDLYLAGPLPLAFGLHGQFPEIDSEFSRAATPTAPRDGKNPSPGTMILSGSSEMFANQNLYLEGYQHARFLLNTAASLAFTPEIAALQARVKFPKSFSAQSRGAKIMWRSIVVFAFPLGLLLYAVWRFTRQRRVVEV